MKIITKVFLTLLLLLTISSSTNAQLFQLGAGGGLTQILAPKYYTNSEGDEPGLGFSTEWNAGVIAKLGLPLIPVTPRAYFLYHSLTGNRDLNPLYYQDPTVEYTQTISEIGLGIQYNFIPMPAGFDPYIALDLSYNIFSSLEGNGIEVPNTQVNRFGGDIGIGTEITIIPILDFDVYASYKMFNLIGKENDEETISAFTLDVFVLFSFL
jgi:hypothetical protein